MSPRHRGRQAIYLVVVPADFRPCSFWTVPDSFTDAVIVAKNLHMWEALGYARSHNRRAVQNRVPGRKWAIVARHIKSRRTGEHPDAVAKRRAGKGVAK